MLTLIKFYRHIKWSIKYASQNDVKLGTITTESEFDELCKLIKTGENDQTTTNGPVGLILPFFSNTNIVHQTVLRLRTNVSYYYKYEQLFYTPIGIRIIDRVIIFNNISLYKKYLVWLDNYIKESIRFKNAGIKQVMDFISEPSVVSGQHIPFTLKQPHLRLEPSDLTKLFLN